MFNNEGTHEFITLLLIGVWIIIYIALAVSLDYQWRKIMNHDSRIRKLESKKSCNYGKEKIEGGKAKEGKETEGTAS